MKRIGRKHNFGRNICTLVIGFVLICCNLSALAGSTNTASRQDTTNATVVHNSGDSRGSVILLQENFTDGQMPPTGDLGDWVHKKTNPTQTWQIDSSDPYSEPYCAYVYRGSSTTVLDEWLITPSINFSGYSKINLTFWWWTCLYVSAWKKYTEFNISISTDGGTNWTKIWRFNDINATFDDWVWYNTNYPGAKPIDLSAYAGQKDVRIAFQYYSNNTSNANLQRFKIDDIRVIAMSGINVLECNPGGPYSWYWPMQLKYQPWGVRFHGNLQNATMFTTTIWDFGDGTVTSYTPFNVEPIHFYVSNGTYNVILTAIDNSTTPNRYATENTSITLYLLEPSNITFVVPRLSIIKINVDIINKGKYNATATNVNWTMNISWGLLQKRERNIANGTIEKIENGSSVTVQNKQYFYGFGRLHVIISAYPENFPGWTKHFSGFKIGPLIFLS